MELLVPGTFDERSEPLHRRAWTLQERLLSPRLLVFPSRGGLIWQCEKLETFEGKMYSLVGDTCRYRLPSLAVKRGRDVMDVWYTMVFDYSQRKLTNSDDKLIAISALAQVYFSRWARELGAYIAGHWSSFLRESLLWIVTFHGPSKSKLEVAPSWSWASADSAVCYNQRTKAPASAYFEILEYRAERSDPFGAVERGTLRVEGMIAKAQLHKAPHSHFDPFQRFVYYVEWLDVPRGNGLLGSFHFDFESMNIEPPPEVELLFCDAEQGIMIEEVSTGTYIRTGRFGFSSQTAVTNGDNEVRIITLI
jgi:hypothetical protein